jgi:hypothetical protein
VVLDSREVAGGYFELSRDFLDVVVRFTDAPPILRGTVVDQAGRLMPGCSVFLFPMDQRLWSLPRLPLSFRRTSADNDGRFEFPDFIAGSFLVSARALDSTGDWRDTTFLAELANHAVSVSFENKKLADVRLVVSGSK